MSIQRIEAFFTIASATRRKDARVSTSLGRMEMREKGAAPRSSHGDATDEAFEFPQLQDILYKTTHLMDTVFIGPKQQNTGVAGAVTGSNLDIGLLDLPQKEVCSICGASNCSIFFKILLDFQIGPPQINSALGIQPEIGEKIASWSLLLQFNMDRTDKQSLPAYGGAEDDQGSSMAALNWILWFSPGILDSKRQECILL